MTKFELQLWQVNVVGLPWKTRGIKGLWTKITHIRNICLQAYKVLSKSGEKCWVSSFSRRAQSRYAVFGNGSRKIKWQQTRKKSWSRCEIKFPFQKCKFQCATTNIKGDTATLWPKSKVSRFKTTFLSRLAAILTTKMVNKWAKRHLGRKGVQFQKKEARGNNFALLLVA